MFLDETPILLSPTLACLVGDRGAMILQEIHKALMTDEAIVDRAGTIWVRRSAAQLKLYLPFLHENTIRNALLRLEKAGYLESTTGLGDNVLDQSKWYTLNHEMLMTAVALKKTEFLQISSTLNAMRKREPEASATNRSLSVDQQTKLAMLNWSVDLFLRLTGLNNDLSKNWAKAQILWLTPLKQILVGCMYVPDVVELVLRESLERATGLTVASPKTILSTALSVIAEIKRGAFPRKTPNKSWTQL
jgi:hypothetical protein